MKSITPALEAHFGQALTSIATCWKVTRRDGSVMGFTDHDRILTIDGLSYEASSGYMRSAIANSATASVDNLEVRGFLDDERISEEELRNGAYDFAEVEIFAVNWEDLSMGICRLRYGYFGEVTLRPSGLFVVELRGLMQLFSQTVGETIGPDCRADLGDDRCKVALVPELRRSGKEYKEGDRVIVINDPDKTPIRLNTLNPNFEWFQTTDLHNWEFSAAHVANYPRRAFEGEYYIRPSQATGYARHRIGIPEVEDPGVTINIQVTVMATVRAFEPGWQLGAFVEMIHAGGLFGLALIVLDSKEVPYRTIGDVGSWTNYMENIVESMNPVGANTIRITWRWRPGPDAANPTQAAPIQIDKPRVSTTMHDELESEWFNLDNFLTTVVNSVPEWSGSGGTRRTHPGNHNLMPRQGRFMLSQLSGGQAFQTYDLLAAGADIVAIDAGGYKARAIAYAGSFEWGSTSRIRLEFRNASNQLITTATTSFEALRPAGVWHLRTLAFNVPPTARTVTLRLDGGLTPERTGDGTSSTVCWDEVEVWLEHIDVDVNMDYTLFGGVEYIALNTGHAATTQPAFTHTLGEFVTDGDITWQAVIPEFTFLGEVDEVFSHSEFTIPGINAPDNWFRWGVLTFLSGPNRFKGVEVLAWNNTTKRITLMLPALRPIEQGTVIRVHAGCDKTRGPEGCGRYDNILNFRGEPEVPGTDHYFRVGGTGAA